MSDEFSGFGDLIEEAEERSGFDWDADEVEADDSEEMTTVLRFTVGDRRFAVPGERVVEVTSDLDITPVPGSPEHIEGVCVVRRQVVGVLSLLRWLDPVVGETDFDFERIVIIEVDQFTVGVEVTEVSGIEEWPRSVLDKDSVPSSLNARTRRYALGVRSTEDGPAVVLDVGRLLADAAVN